MSTYVFFWLLLHELYFSVLEGVPTAPSHLFIVLYWPAGIHFLFCTCIHTIEYRALLPRLGLRPGWSDTLQSLATKGVPTYLFSSGYGDVVTQVLLQGMGSAAGGAGGAGAAGSARYDMYCLFCVLFCCFVLSYIFLNWCVRVDTFKFFAIDNPLVPFHLLFSIIIFLYILIALRVSLNRCHRTCV